MEVAQKVDSSVVRLHKYDSNKWSAGGGVKYKKNLWTSLMESSHVNRIETGSVAISGVAFFHHHHHHHQEQREKKSPPFFEGCVIRDSSSLPRVS